MKKKYQLVLITGGSSGIGLALAKQLVQEGSDVCLLARDQSKLDQAQREVADLKIKESQFVETLSCDIADYKSLEEKLEAWMANFGVPDLVINSAGVTYPGYFQEIDVEIFHWLMDVNYYGTLHILKIIIPKMISRSSGTVINISSQAGFAGVFGYSGYGASKYAVRGLSDVLRSEMKPLGIQVAIIFPPDTETPQLAFEEPLKPKETRAIASSSKALSPEHVANTTLREVRKGKYVITPGVEGKIFYRLVGWLGNLTYPVIDWMVRRAKKNK